MLPDIQWLAVWSNLAQLGIAYVLAFPIGWDRERRHRGPGLRTFPLVAVGSCGYLLIGLQMLGDDPTAQARLLYGLMTGIGFIGGGAILKSQGNVSGTSTAASIWFTGAIGASVAWYRYEIGIALSVVTFVTMHWIRYAKEFMPEEGPDRASEE